MFQDRRDNQFKYFNSKTFFPENRAVYEVMWKNIVLLVRLQMTIWRMRIACWTTESTHTHSEYVYVLLFHGNNGCTKRPIVTLKNTVLSPPSYSVFIY